MAEKEFGQIPQELQNDPRLDSVVGIENPIAELDVDIIIEDMPDLVTIQQEQQELLAPLVERGLVPPKVLIQSSNLRDNLVSGKLHIPIQQSIFSRFT